MNPIGKVLRHLAGAAAALCLLVTGGGLVAAETAGLLNLTPPPGMPQLNYKTANGKIAHVMPTVKMMAQMRKAAPPPSNMTYQGYPVMTPNVTVYTIFWKPSGTTLATNYRQVINGMLANYAGHEFANNNTQYYQTIASKTTYVSGLGKLGGTYTDTDPFPSSGCNISVPVAGVTTKGCLTDSQVQDEVAKVMAITKPGKTAWSVAPSNVFLLSTPQGLETCFDDGSACSYLGYCAYHAGSSNYSPYFIYAQIPYGEPSACNAGVDASQLPNGLGGYADTGAAAAALEVSEATIDPLPGGSWFDFTANMEGSDKCIGQYGTNSWDGGKANYQWAGLNLELPMQWSNHANGSTGGCVLNGP